MFKIQIQQHGQILVITANAKELNMKKKEIKAQSSKVGKNIIEQIKKEVKDRAAAAWSDFSNHSKR